MRIRVDVWKWQVFALARSSPRNCSQLQEGPLTLQAAVSNRRRGPCYCNRPYTITSTTSRVVWDRARRVGAQLEGNTPRLMCLRGQFQVTVFTHHAMASSDMHVRHTWLHTDIGSPCSQTSWNVLTPTSIYPPPHLIWPQDRSNFILSNSFTLPVTHKTSPHRS